MSIRLRLALWYGALFALVLSLVGLFSYALHVHSLYDDLDRALVMSASHAAVEAAASVGPYIVKGDDIGVALRRYDPNGILQESSIRSEQSPPPIDPRTALAAPAGPPFDALVGLVPPLEPLPAGSNEGAFGLLLDPAGQRWRNYVLPLRRGGAPAGYIETLTPLGRLDTSMWRFRTILLVLGLSGLATALAGAWVVAGRALRPIARMVQTARAIATSRDLARRVAVPARRDELGHLAETFNEMLAGLEEAYRTQQRFISDASHELRAPLTVIQGNLEFLRRRQAVPEEERAEVLAEVEREAERLARLVADLLALARADAGLSLRRHPVDLDLAVLEGFRGARSLSRGQTLTLVTLEPAQVLGDADRLKQLLFILLDNALKYTPPDGSVTIGLQVNNRVAKLTIQDTGPGIPPEALPHVFERFFRADPARARDPGGTGLGLSIAHWIVEQHGGHIELTSEPGHGTVVVVSLPTKSGRPQIGQAPQRNLAKVARSSSHTR